MTNRERVLAALHFEKPDRIPYQVDFTGQMLEKMNAFTGEADYRRTLGNHITSVSLTKPDTEIRPAYFRDEFGVVWNRSGADKDVGVIDAALLRDPNALVDFILPEVDEGFIRSRMEALQAASSDNFRAASIIFSLFERAWTLRGMADLLCDMLIDPDFVDALLGRICERNMRILDIALEYDFDCFYFGDDWGQQRGLIMGPVHWRRFVKPHLARMYDRVHAAGKYVAQHSCGDLRDILDELYEMGLNIYQTFQPEIYGYDYAKNIHGKITIWGGISTQRDLPYRSPGEIREITHQVLDAFPCGGLLAAPTHAVPADVPPENILAMMQVLRGEA